MRHDKTNVSYAAGQSPAYSGDNTTKQRILHDWKRLRTPRAARRIDVIAGDENEMGLQPKWTGATTENGADRGEGIEATARRLYRRTRDKRLQRRILIDAAAAPEVVLRPDEAPGVIIFGRLSDISGGGCCVTVPPWTLEVLSEGGECSIGLPVLPRQFQHYPATVVTLLPAYLNGKEDPRLRIRFRATDIVARAQLTRWVNSMAIRAWYS